MLRASTPKSIPAKAKPLQDAKQSLASRDAATLPGAEVPDRGARRRGRPMKKEKFSWSEQTVLEELYTQDGNILPKHPRLLRRVIWALLNRINILDKNRGNRAAEARLFLKLLTAHEGKVRKMFSLTGNTLQGPPETWIGHLLLNDRAIKGQLLGLATGIVRGNHYIPCVKEQRRLLWGYWMQHQDMKPVVNNASLIRAEYLRWVARNQEGLLDITQSIPCLCQCQYQPHSQSLDGFTLPSQDTLKPNESYTPGGLLRAILAKLHGTTPTHIQKLLKTPSPK